MARFKPGQEVVCIKDGGWEVVYRGPLAPEGNCLRGPKFNEVCTVKECLYISECGINFILLEEYPGRDGYGEKWFEPLVTSEQLTEALKIKSEVAEA